MTKMTLSAVRRIYPAVIHVKCKPKQGVWMRLPSCMGMPKLGGSVGHGNVGQKEQKVQSLSIPIFRYNACMRQEYT